jgi:thiol-disulfide isomerase/thioredoxin
VFFAFFRGDFAAVLWRCSLVKARLIVHNRGMLLRFLPFGILLLTFFAQAAPLQLDILTVGSKTYSNITVVGFNTTDLYFTERGSIWNVKLKYLNADLQKRFSYDPKAAAEAEQKQAEEDRLYQKTLADDIAAQYEKTHPTEKNTNAPPKKLADPISEKSLLGKPAPALKVDKWLSDKPALEGKYVLITLWATWSAPCRALIPDLNALQKKFPERLVVVGLSSETETNVIAMTEPKIEFASAIDSTAKLTTDAGITSIPTVLLLDPKGIVLYQGHPAALTEQHFQALLVPPPETSPLPERSRPSDSGSN